MLRFEHIGCATKYVFPTLGRSADSPESDERPSLSIDVRLTSAALVRGQVVDSASRPVAGAALMAIHEIRGSTSDSLSLAGAQSSSDGTFLLDTLSTGSFRLSAIAPSFLPTEVRASAPAEDLVIRLESARGSAAGHVYSWATRESISSATVRLRSIHRNSGRDYTAETDNLGGFIISDLPAGRYQIFAQKESLAQIPRSVTPSGTLSIASGESTSGLEIFLYAGHTVNGTVRDPLTSRTVENVRVSWPGGKNKPGSVTQTGSAGNFRLENVFADAIATVTLAASKPGYLVLPDRAGNYSSLELPLSMDSLETSTTIEMVHTVALSGKVVTSDGKPVPAASVSAWVAGEHHPRAYSIQTNTAGVFVLQVLPFSTVRIMAEAPGFPATFSSDVELEDGPVSGITIVLHTGATISGIVQDPFGTPIPDAAVALALNLQVGPTRLQERIGSATDSGAAVTDSAGRFTFSNLPAETLSLVASKTGFAPSASKVIKLQPGENKIDLVLTLRPALVISGHVYDRDSKPIAFASITATMRTPGAASTASQLESERASQSSAETDSQGYYRLENIAEGLYSIDATHPDFGSENRKDIPAGSSDIDFVLGLQQSSANPSAAAQSQSAVLIGTVIDWRTGKPLDQFTVQDVSSQQITRDASAPGRFIAPATPGVNAWRFAIRSPGYSDLDSGWIAVVPGRTRQQTFRMAPGGTVIGHLVSRNRNISLSKVPVTVTSTGIEPVPSEKRQLQTSTLSDGSFRIDAVWPGVVTVLLSPPKPLVEITRRGEVLTGQVLDLGEIEIGGGGRVVGTVVRTPSNRPISGVNVSIQPQGAATANQDVTDQQGRFDFTGIDAGVPYVVQLPGYQQNQTVAVNAGETAELLFRIGSAGLQGRLLRAGKGVQGFVKVTDSNGASKTSPTGADGTYQFNELAAGTWQLEGSSFEGDSAGTAHDSVVLTDGRTETKDLVLASGRITGRVLDADGKAVPQASVTATEGNDTAAGGGSGGRTFTATAAQDGTFEIAGVPPGTYTVSARSSTASGSVSGVQVPAGHESSPVTITIRGGGTGTLISRATNYADKQPMKQAWLYLYSALDGTKIEHNRTRDENGIMVIDGISAGSYNVEVSSWGFSVGEHTVQISGGQTAQINDALYDAGAFRWTIRDRGGNAMRAVPAELTPNDPNSIERVRSGQTGDNGTWVVRGLFPGSYTATGRPNGSSPITIQVQIEARQPTDITTQLGAGN